MDIDDPFDPSGDALHADTGHQDMLPTGGLGSEVEHTGDPVGPVGGGLDDGLDNDGTDGSGGGESTATHDTDPTISVVINGVPMEGHATLDTDGDGTRDTAIIDLDDGYRAAVTDVTGDGHADRAQLMDRSGHVVDNQHIDASGNWVDDGNSAGSVGTTGDSGTTTVDHSDPAPAAPHGDSTHLTIDYAGQQYTAEATIDTTGDGRPDSGVLTDPSSGARYVVTDFDGDGRADHITVYDGEGHETAAGGLTHDGRVIPDGGDNDHRPTYAVDPTTGEWVTR